MKYQDMYNRIFMRVERPNGFFGDMVNVGLAIVDNCLYEVADCGYYRCPAIPTVMDEKEVFWLVEHHPNFRNYKYKESTPC